jgi:hypothetical protein
MKLIMLRSRQETTHPWLWTLPELGPVQGGAKVDPIPVMAAAEGITLHKIRV